MAAALAVACWWALRAGGHSTAVPTGAVPVPDASPSVLVTPRTGSGVATAVAAPSAPSPSPSTIVVDVAGKVHHPGIVTLPLGARVVDALEAAGGARRGVDLRVLNLARVLADGEQVVVGLPQPGGLAASAASGGTGGTGAPALVNINTATQAQLETLPGVGPVTAQAILAWRTDNGPFSSVDELVEVSGIGQATLTKIAPYVTL